jgi:hypothetical protein
MSVVEKRSPPHDLDLAATDSEMTATTSICVALVVTLIVYVLGVAVFQQDVVAGAPGRAGQAATSFHGP